MGAGNADVMAAAREGDGYGKGVYVVVGWSACSRTGAVVVVSAAERGRACIAFSWGLGCEPRLQWTLS